MLYCNMRKWYIYMLPKNPGKQSWSVPHIDYMVTLMYTMFWSSRLFFLFMADLINEHVSHQNTRILGLICDVIVIKPHYQDNESDYTSPNVNCDVLCLSSTLFLAMTTIMSVYNYRNVIYTNPSFLLSLCAFFSCQIHFNQDIITKLSNQLPCFYLLHVQYTPYN